MHPSETGIGFRPIDPLRMRKEMNPRGKFLECLDDNRGWGSGRQGGGIKADILEAILAFRSSRRIKASSHEKRRRKRLQGLIEHLEPAPMIVMPMAEDNRIQVRQVYSEESGVLKEGRALSRIEE